jgi:hypothetical protein
VRKKSPTDTSTTPTTMTVKDVTAVEAAEKKAAAETKL